VEEVVATGYAELGDNMLRGLRATSGPRGLRIMTDEVVEYALLYPRLMEMMLSPRTRDEPMVARLQTQVERCMRADIIGVRNPTRTAALLWSQMRGVLSRRHDHTHLRAAFDWAMSEVLQPLAA
jgi:hypothetical protein